MACVVLTLFVPVLPSSLMWKERGGLTACVIAGSTVAIAFVSGLILNASPAVGLCCSVCDRKGYPVKEETTAVRHNKDSQVVSLCQLNRVNAK